MRRLFLFILCPVFLTPLLAVKTQSIKQATYDQFVQGEFTNLSLSNLGELEPGRSLEKIAELEAESILSAALADDGTLFLGTGAKGEVYKLTEGGEPEVILSPQEIMTAAMAIGPDAALYCATSPDGRVYRIVEGQRPEVYFDPEPTYIWDLLFDDDGALYVATGKDAVIYRLPPDFMPGDEAEEWFKSETHTHFNSLAFDYEARLLAGAGPKAYLYRVLEKDKAEVLFNAGTEEIPEIVAMEDGSIVFSTMHKGGSSKSNHSPLDLPSLIQKVHEASKSSNGGGASNDKSGDQAGAAPTSGPSFLMRITPEGFDEILWSPGAHNILSFYLNEAGDFMVGTDEEARLFSVASRTDWSLLAQAETGGSISALLSDGGDGLYVLTSNPAVIYRLAASPSEDEVYLSDILDAGAIAHWGRLLPVGQGVLDEDIVSWQTRTGNSPEPDDTWSDWQALESMAVASPTGRYLQYELTFKEGGDEALSPALRELRLFYAHNNAAPMVKRINILPVGLQMITVPAPPKPVNISQLTGSKQMSLKLPSQPAMRTQVRARDDMGAYSFGWNAVDPNGDSLTYALAVSQADSAAQAILVDDLDESVYSTSMRGFEDGYYRAHVTASDAKSNLPGKGLSGSLTSELFLVDNTSPVIVVDTPVVESSSVTVHFTAKDEYSIITEASYVLNGQPAEKIFPESGFFDSQEATFKLVLDELTPGSYSLLLEVVDESNNQASAQTHFVIP